MEPDTAAPSSAPPKRPSIHRRLAIGLSLVGCAGCVLLLSSVLIEYRISLADLHGSEASVRAVREVVEHVAMPVLILILPMALAGMWVIRRELRPLIEAATQIENARTDKPGVRVETSALPAEALPFAEAVNRLLGRLDEAARAREAFVADLAHELRTPLAILSLELDRLDHPDAGRLKGDVLVMRRLIDQLMLLAQIDAAAFAHIPPDRVSLDAVCRETVAMMAPQAYAAGREIAFVGDPAQISVDGRKEAIGAALRNLVENAVRATPMGGTVTVRAGPGPVIAVRDEGEGIPADRLDNLVRRLSRADHASPSGAGLGLAIVHLIITAHGGTLTTDPGRRELVLSFPPQTGATVTACAP